MPAVEICSRQVGRRHDDLGQAHIVVRHEHHLQQPAHRRIAIDDPRDIVGKLDDQLGVVVARRRLAARRILTRGTQSLSGCERIWS